MRLLSKALGLAVREGEQAAKSVPAKRVPATVVAERAPISRKRVPADVVSDFSTRLRREGAARRGHPREGSFAVRTPDITPDPRLAAVKFTPGGARSATAQAAEMMVPVAGRAPFEAQHASGYSRRIHGTGGSPEGVEATYRRRVPEVETQVVAPSMVEEGAGLFPMIGDRTIGDLSLTSIGGLQLAHPVDLLGGGRFAWGQKGAGGSAGWGSDADRLAQQAMDIQDYMRATGKPVYGVHYAMGPESGDFSHQNTRALFGALNALDLPRSTLSVIDDYVRSGAKGVPDFVGFADDPHLALFDMLLRPGADRANLIKQFDKMPSKLAAAHGVPDIAGQVRVAATEPELRWAPQGASGFSVVRFKPERFLSVDPGLLKPAIRRQVLERGDLLSDALPEIPHPDYNAQLLVDELRGRTERLLPGEMLWRDPFRAINEKGSATTTQTRQRAFETGGVRSIQRVDPELQDATEKYLEAVRGYPEHGFAKGGRVKAGLAVRR